MIETGLTGMEEYVISGFSKKDKGMGADDYELE